MLQHSLHPATQMVWRKPTTLLWFLFNRFYSYSLQMLKGMMAPGFGNVSVSRAHLFADINNNMSPFAVFMLKICNFICIFLFFNVANVFLATQIFSSCLRFLVGLYFCGCTLQGQCIARGVRVQITWSQGAAEAFKSVCKAQSSSAPRLGITALL